MKTRTIDFTSLKTSATAIGVASVIALGALSQAFADTPNQNMTHAQMNAQCSQHMKEMKSMDSDLTNTNHHRS